MYLKGLLAEGCSIVVSVRDGNIVFNVEKPAENAVVDTENSTTDNMKQITQPLNDCFGIVAQKSIYFRTPE